MTIGVAIAIAVGGALLLAISLVLWRVQSGNAARAAAVLQASAAATGLIGTGALVGVTAYYAWVTGEILRYSRPDVRVDLRQGWTDLASGVMTAPIDGREHASVDERYSRPVWAVNVRNAGGAAVTVDRVAIELHGQSMSFIPTETLGASPPHRLDSHSSIDVYFETPEGALGRMAEYFKVKRRMRARCELGSGEVAVSDWKAIPPAR